jgi:P27 family predicted phage terminase small subunit
MKGRPPKVKPAPGQAAISGIPKCPRSLDEVAKKKWKEITKLLHRAGVLTELDGDLLAEYCRLHAEEQELLELLAAAPNRYVLAAETGPVYLNPLRRELKIVRELLARVRVELGGLGPVGRTRLQINEKKPEGVKRRDRSQSSLPPPAVAGKIG